MAVNLIAAAVAMSEAAAVTKFIVTAAAMVINYDRAQAKAAQAEAAAAAQMAAAAARGVLLNVSGNIESIPVIYGARKVGGIRTLVEVSGASNEYLHVVLVLGESEISAINDIMIDDTPWTDARFSGLVSIEQHLGTDVQAASAALIADIPSKWTAEHKGSGIAYMVIKFKYDRSAYPFGLPTVTSVPDGRVLYDPRSGLYAFSDNPALVIRDYLTSERYGLGVDADNVDDASFTAAANYCDEMVVIPDGTQKRYTCVGLVDTSLTVYENMKKLLTSCRGSLVFSGGKYKLVLDKPDDLFLIGGTAQAAAVQSLTLAAGVSEVDDTYKNMTVRLTSGAGAVQERNVVTSRKNILKYSQSLNNAIWTSTYTRTTDATTAPDGTLTAELCVIPAGYWSGGIAILQYATVVAGETFTFSIYAKRNGTTFNSICLFTGVLSARARFNLGTLAISNTLYCTPAIEDVGGGWCRCSIAVDCNVTGNHYFSIYAENFAAVTGDGVGGYYLWGGQVEVGATATEYIHTEANSAVGVAVDVPWSSNDYSYSEDFSNVYWGKNNVTITPNAITAPDGTLTADKVVSNVFTGRLAISKSLAAVANQKYTAQFSLKAGEFNVVTLFFDNTTCAEGAYYGSTVTLNLSTGVSSNPSIVSLESQGDGWYRATMTATPTIATTYFKVAVNDSGGVNSAIGDGVKGFYIWGGQRSAGSIKVPYIKTDGAAILPPDSTSTYEIDRKRFAFTEDNITGAWEIRPPSRSEKFNRVTATFNNPAKNWQPDLAIQQSIPYRIADGGKVIEGKLDLPFTADMYTAQQIAQQELKQSRFGTNVRFRAFQEGLQCDVGDVVSITHSTPNWTDKAFRIINLNPLDTDEVEVVCREYDESVFTLDPLTLYSPAAAANLPDASSISMPGNLAVVESLYHTSGSVGVRSRASVSWTAPADPYVLNYELEYRKDSGNWVEVFNIRGTSIDIDDLPVGMYEWRVKTMNVIGVVSEYSTIVKKPIYGLTAAPADVSGFGIVATGGQARATWGLHPDLDVRLGGRILIRWSNLTVGATWMNAVPIGEANGDAMTVMLPLLGGTYLARAEDSTGNLSSNDASFGADEALATGWTTVATSTQHAAFAGVKTNLALVGGTIKLSNSVLFDDIPGLIDTWSLLDNYGGTLPSGSYEFDAPLNFGTLAVRKLTAHIASTSFEIGDLFDSRSGLIDTWDDFDGAEVLDCAADLYVSTSPDAVSYGAWTPFMSGEFNCMSAKFRLDLSSATNTHNIAVSELSVTARIAV